MVDETAEVGGIAEAEVVRDRAGGPLGAAQEAARFWQPPLGDDVPCGRPVPTWAARLRVRTEQPSIRAWSSTRRRSRKWRSMASRKRW
ncbi:hypothetical protein [Streptomyces sp. 8K308]|uniref:hypothetical protein n=1 Tax=Streptomyces sp. 8K308 TaxID=2530388 RepID=UPI0014043DF6